MCRHPHLQTCHVYLPSLYTSGRLGSWCNCYETCTRRQCSCDCDRNNGMIIAIICHVWMHWVCVRCIQWTLLSSLQVRSLHYRSWSICLSRKTHYHVAIVCWYLTQQQVISRSVADNRHQHTYIYLEPYSLPHSSRLVLYKWRWWLIYHSLHEHSAFIFNVLTLTSRVPVSPPLTGHSVPHTNCMHMFAHLQISHALCMDVHVIPCRRLACFNTQG